MARGDSVLTLSVVDREDGRVREVPLRCLRDDEHWYVMAPATPLPRWFASALDASRVRWRVGEHVFEGSAVRVDDIVGVRARFESSFGTERVTRWLGPAAVALTLVAQPPPAADYATEVERYFDRAAADYDRLVESNPLNRFLRTASLEILRRSFRPGDRVLEIGCGTGLETIPLAADGIELVATDVSGIMLDRLRSKAEAAGVSGRITTRKVRARDLAVLEREYGEGAFQGAFSTFGALNCEPAWGDLPGTLARLLAQGSSVILGVWNRVCLFELAAYAVAGRPRRALARLASPAPVGLTRFGIPVYPATVRDYVRAFRPTFKVQSVRGLPVLLPPYDLVGHLPRPDALLPLLASMDQSVRSHYPFNRLGDHFVLVLRREDDEVRTRPPCWA